MARARGNMGLTALIVVVVLLLHQTCTTSAKADHHYPASSCGSIHNISYPFRLTSDPKKCGNPKYTLSCENNQAVLQLYSGKYYVREINYDNYTIRVVDPGVVNDNHPFIPRYLLAKTNFSSGDPYQASTTVSLSDLMIFVKCEKPVMNSRYYLNISACVDDEEDDGRSSSKRYTYALFSNEFSDRRSAVQLGDLCQVAQISLTSSSYRYDGILWNLSCTDFRSEFLWNFELSWYRAYCGICKDGYCNLDYSNKIVCYGDGRLGRRGRCTKILREH